MVDTQASGRKQERADALAAAVALLEGATETSPELDALSALVNAVTPRKRSAGPRVKLEPADPDTVREYFESTGLTRKQIAAAAGVSTSVVSTVQNPKGDRWSTVTFEAKRALIDAYVVEHADEIEAARQADLAAAAAKQAKAQAKQTRAAARAAGTKPAKTAAPRQKAASVQPGQNVTKAPRRRVTATPATPVTVVAAG